MSKETMYASILQHGENLNNIFNTGIEPVILCKKLRRLELKAHRLATDYCNGDIYGETFDKIEAKIMRKLQVILFGKRFPNVPIFLNQDARGYALKIDDIWLREKRHDIYKDWGGYGIIAPDFSN